MLKNNKITILIIIFLLLILASLFKRVFSEYKIKKYKEEIERLRTDIADIKSKTEIKYLELEEQLQKQEDLILEIRSKYTKNSKDIDKLDVEIEELRKRKETLLTNLLN